MELTDEFREQLKKRAEELKENVATNNDDTINFDDIKTQRAFKKVLLESFQDAGMILEDILYRMAWKIEEK